MTSLLRNTRRTSIALAIAFALAILPGLVAPLISDELANTLPGVTRVFADESAGHGG